MLLRDAIDASEFKLVEVAERVDCSHNHLSQCASLKKALSGSLAVKLKRLLPDFSIEDQQEAFEAADAVRRGATSAPEAAA
jgi:hypothetical protein